MNIFRSLKPLKDTAIPIALTIGNFDGVHLGHQAVLQRLKSIGAHSVVLTFSNHPCKVLKNDSVSFLSTLSHRLELFQKIGIDSTYLIEFTRQFSSQSAHCFLKFLKQLIPFSHLILGHDAMIGCDRNSDLGQISEELGFTLEYLEPFSIGQQVVSSSSIRECIHEGNLIQASLLLGRPYSIFAAVEPGSQKGRALGIHTANLPVQELALPPLGVYAVKVNDQGRCFPAVANIGHAPTLHHNRPAFLEVHLLETTQDLYGHELEVVFTEFIRPEKHFASATELKEQINSDILAAKKTFV